MAESFTNHSEEIEKIDIIQILLTVWKSFRKSWFIGIILVAVLGAFYTFGAVKSYRPSYTAYADFVVNANSDSSNYVNKVTVQQLSNTFPYILTSGALQKVVMEELELSYLPVSISASGIEETSIFQIKATGSDPQMTYDVLSGIIKHYPDLAKYIIGSTSLTFLDESGVPETPNNVLSVKRETVKGISLGIIVYGLILLALSMLRRTVISSADLKRHTQVPCLAGIPDAGRKKRIARKARPVLIGEATAGTHYDEAINSLRIRIEKIAQEKHKKVFLFTSVGKDEGKTTVCSNLALALAMKGYKVMLIDGDLRNPSVADCLGMTAEKGLVDALKREATLKDVLIKREDLPLYVLPGGKSISNTTGLLAKKTFSSLLGSAARQMDFVLIDSAPCGMMQDATLMAASAKNVIMVIRQDFSLRMRVLECIDMIRETGGSVEGYVINREETGIGSYGYGKYGYGKYGYGKYGYGHKYGYGYGAKDKKVSE